MLTQEWDKTSENLLKGFSHCDKLMICLEFFMLLFQVTASHFKYISKRRKKAYLDFGDVKKSGSIPFSSLAHRF